MYLSAEQTDEQTNNKNTIYKKIEAMLTPLITFVKLCTLVFCFITCLFGISVGVAFDIVKSEPLQFFSKLMSHEFRCECDVRQSGVSIMWVMSHHPHYLQYIMLMT